jgi:hypothetical protein
VRGAETMTDWQPGDPLYEYDRGCWTHTLPIFELRDDSPDTPEVDNWRGSGKAARWPTPTPHADLDRYHSSHWRVSP